MRLPAPVPAATALVGLGGVKRTFRCDGGVKRTFRCEELLSVPIGARSC